MMKNEQDPPPETTGGMTILGGVLVKHAQLEHEEIIRKKNQVLNLRTPPEKMPRNDEFEESPGK